LTWNLFMHGVGIACLLCIAAIAIGIIAASIVPNWRRIWDTACGRPWPISRHPVSPTASVLPLRTSLPPLHTDEAGAQPTNSKRAA
jgi:hypothetical protein